MIKLLTFDLDNTLWSVDPIIIRAENAMMEWLYEHYPELRFRISLVQFEQYKNKIGYWERGKFLPLTVQLPRIAKALQVSIDWLFVKEP